MLLHSNIIGEGKPFVILHGFLGMSDNWKTLGLQFAEQNFQIHLVDQRNHGHSFHSEEFNYDVLVEDLKHYCDEHQLENIILLGHSMGGKTAMLFATKYPELVSKLLIADISPRFYPIHHDGILNGLSALNFDAIKSRGEADTLLSGYISKEQLSLLKGSVPFKHLRKGRGNILLLTDNTNFRAFWYGTNKLLMNAIFFGKMM